MISINFVPLHDRDKFYENTDLNRLVEICLQYLNTDILYHVSLLIKRKSLSNRLIKRFKNQSPFLKDIYSEIEVLINSLYAAEDSDNLRGAFLELLIFKFLLSKYDSQINGLNGNVYINHKRCPYSVDVFFKCISEGFACECKIGYKGFDADDISNLNRIFKKSNSFIKPFIISFADSDLLLDKLKQLNIELSNMNIISRDNMDDFFYN